MKTSLRNVILLNLFMLCAHGGEVEQFICETLEEQRARSECEPSEVAKVVGDAINDSKLPEFELPKESIFTSKDKENDARYYSYDKSGKLISVEYAARPEKNEYYAYDKQGNILEKRIGNSIYKYTYDTANQLMEMESPEGTREYFYDRAGRLIIEKFNGEIDVEYKYGFLDKVIEVNRNGKTTKFAYDGFGMLAQKTFHDGSTEVWVWDGLALIRRGSDIYVNEPHISGGVPILSKTDEGVRYHEHDFLGTTLWSMDTKGNLVKDYQDTTIFGEGSIQKDRSARFTGKPYDEDLQAYVFPYRNYDASTARWRSSDPAGYPDGINQHFYAAVPTYAIDIWGLDVWHMNDSKALGSSSSSGQSAVPGTGLGHSAWIVGNDRDGYTAYNYGSDYNTKTQHSSLKEAMASLGDRFDRAQHIGTTSVQDAAFISGADHFRNPDLFSYSIHDHNCYQLGVEGFRYMFNDTGDLPPYIDPGYLKSPNAAFEANAKNGWDNAVIER